MSLPEVLLIALVFIVFLTFGLWFWGTCTDPYDTLTEDDAGHDGDEEMP